MGLAVGVKTCGPHGCRTHRLYERSDYGGLTLRYALNSRAVAFMGSTHFVNAGKGQCNK